MYNIHITAIHLNSFYIQWREAGILRYDSSGPFYTSILGWDESHPRRNFHFTDYKWSPNGNVHTSYPKVKEEESHWGLDSQEGVRRELRKPAKIEMHIWMNDFAKYCCHFHVQLVVLTEVTQGILTFAF